MHLLMQLRMLHHREMMRLLLQERDHGCRHRLLQRRVAAVRCCGGSSRCRGEIIFLSSLE